MDISDWLAAAGIGVSAGTLVSVGFGAVWLQHRLEDLRLKREVFRRVVGNIQGILFDCQRFKDSHSFNESGIIAVNEVRAAFPEIDVQNAWSRWYATNDIDSFAELIRQMSVACRLRQYQTMDLEQIAAAFACSCVPNEDGGDIRGS